MSRNLKMAIAITSGSLLAASAGVLTAVQVAQGQEPPGGRTVTVDVATGEQGPKGEQGERGPIGESGPVGPQGPPGTGGGPCAGAPPAYSPGFLEINHPGGQVIIWTCLEPE